MAPMPAEPVTLLDRVNKMRGERNGLQRAAGTLAGVAAISLAMAACSSVANLIGTSSADKPAASGATSTDPGASTGTGVAELKPEDYACPDVTVRPGAATLTIGGKPSATEPGAMELRYQGTLVRFARDCTPRAGTMTMKVGIEGRVITGPAGVPGNVDVPLRIAVVQEGPEPKTVLSKLVHIPVTIAPDTSSADFTHVDPDIAFPIPKPSGNLESYVVYVGFDPAAAAPQQKPKAKPKRKG
jgi:hypothetical protein